MTKCEEKTSTWKSPIDIVTQISDEISQRTEDAVIEAIKKTGIVVDKEELLRALAYDREQYEKGYSDACKDHVKVIRCEDCRHSEGSLHNLRCGLFYGMGGYHEFCSSAERKESDE